MKNTPTGQIKEFSAQLTRFRLFTLIPRRFLSHYWDNKHCLNFTKWWQWGNRCFFIRNKIIVRPTVSSWDQINSRMVAEDLDAYIIQQCIFTLQTHPKYKDQAPEKIYNKMIEFAMGKE